MKYSVNRFLCVKNNNNSNSNNNSNNNNNNDNRDLFYNNGVPILSEEKFTDPPL